MSLEIIWLARSQNGEGGAYGSTRTWKEINNIVKKCCENLSVKITNSDCGNSTENNRGSSQSWASIATSGTNTETQSMKKVVPKKLTPNPLSHLFVRLSQEYRARTAGLYAVLQKLRADLPANLSYAIKAVHVVPSGLAVRSTAIGEVGTIQATGYPGTQK